MICYLFSSGPSRIQLCAKIRQTEHEEEDEEDEDEEEEEEEEQAWYGDSNTTPPISPSSSIIHQVLWGGVPGARSEHNAGPKGRHTACIAFQYR